jgi:hypothetical protein
MIMNVIVSVIVSVIMKQKGARTPEGLHDHVHDHGQAQAAAGSQGARRGQPLPSRWRISSRTRPASA